MKKIITCLAALLLTLTGCSALAQSVTVTFYDMGKADAALVTTETGARILIDAGTNKGGKKLAERFAGEGIDRIDLMIITHFDKDHVGGADKVLESVSVAQVVMPQYAKESKQYTQFRDALSQSPQTRVEILSAGSEWSADFGKTHLRVTAAEQTDYGVDEEKFLATLDEMCDQAFDDQCTGANPRYPLISEIKEMYLKCYYGK